MKKVYTREEIKSLKEKINQKLKIPTLYVWRTSQEHGLEKTPFSAQLECSDGRTMRKLESLMDSQGWENIGESHDNSNIRIFSKSWKNDEEIQKWALTFPEKVLYLNNQGKEVRWNKKGKRGRPKKV